MSLYPINLQIVDSELQIDWSDGQVRKYGFQELRDACPCATCREKRTGEAPKASPGLVQLDVVSPGSAQSERVVAMKPVGNYAYTIVFGDGHDAGIFPFELLRELGREQ